MAKKLFPNLEVYFLTPSLKGLLLFLPPDPRKLLHPQTSSKSGVPALSNWFLFEWLTCIGSLLSWHVVMFSDNVLLQGSSQVDRRLNPPDAWCTRFGADDVFMFGADRCLMFGADRCFMFGADRCFPVFCPLIEI